MELKLSEKEQRLLLKVDLGELRVEVRRTEDASYRARLHEDEICLRGLIEKTENLAA